MLEKNSQPSTPFTFPKDFPYDGTGWLRRKQDKNMFEFIVGAAAFVYLLDTFFPNQTKESSNKEN